MKAQQKLRPFGVSFVNHTRPGKRASRHVDFTCNVEAQSVDHARHVAARALAKELRIHMPSWATFVGWSSDPLYDGTGYLTAKAARRNGKLSAPYRFTSRLAIEVFPGRVPVQLELDFNDHL